MAIPKECDELDDKAMKLLREAQELTDRERVLWEERTNLAAWGALHEERTQADSRAYAAMVEALDCIHQRDKAL